MVPLIVFCALRGTSGSTWRTTSPPGGRGGTTGSAGLGAAVVGAGRASVTGCLVASEVCVADLPEREYNNPSTIPSTTMIMAAIANPGWRVEELDGIDAGSGGAGTERAAGCMRA